MRETRTYFLYASTVIGVKVVLGVVISYTKNNMIGNSNNPTIVVKNGEVENKKENQLESMLPTHMLKKKCRALLKCFNPIKTIPLHYISRTNVKI